LAVSIVYLIPQMVGAGALIKPLLGLSHVYGVIIVGVVVLVIVVTAGMVSTTYVQFIKGSLLVFFCAILTIAILARGFTVKYPPEQVRVISATQPSDVPRAGEVISIGDGQQTTGPLGPIEFLSRINKVKIVQWTIKPPEAGSKVTTY